MGNRKFNKFIGAIETSPALCEGIKIAQPICMKYGSLQRNRNFAYCYRYPEICEIQDAPLSSILILSRFGWNGFVAILWETYKTGGVNTNKLDLYRIFIFLFDMLY